MNAQEIMSVANLIRQYNFLCLVQTRQEFAVKGEIYELINT